MIFPSPAFMPHHKGTDVLIILKACSTKSRKRGS